MLDKINSWYLTGNRVLTNDAEELTGLELVGKTAAKTNEVVEQVNELEGVIPVQVAGLAAKITEDRKLSESGDFTGTLNGKPIVESEVGLSTAVSAHALNLDKITKDLVTKSVKTNKLFSMGSRNMQDTSGHGAITFIDDDGSFTVLSESGLKPLFLAKNAPLCVACIANDGIMADEAKRADLLVMQNLHGWEILSHTMDHMHYTGATPAQVEADCQEYLATVSSYGFDVKCIATPYGDYGNTDIFARYFMANFCTTSGVNDSTLDTYKIKRHKIGSLMEAPYLTYESLQSVVDDAYLNDKWVVFMSHCGYSDGHGMDYIANMLDYVNGKGMPIVTASEGLRMYGDVVQSGDPTNYLEYYWRLKPNGEVQTNRYSQNHNLQYREYGDLEDLVGGVPVKKTYSNATAPKYYPVGECTKYYSTGDSTGFPTTTGSCKTVRPNAASYGYTYQTWQPNTVVTPYVRRAVSDTTWSSWYRVPTLSDIGFVTGTTNGISETSVPTDVSFTGCTQYTVTGWTTIGNGILLWYKSSVAGYDRQEFLKAGSSLRYSRGWTGSAWTAWA
jgi:peptidoglycan/xylan/chitin deacetylase (PgdA/CDA1 family)